MNYDMRAPCDECPFLRDSGFTFERLFQFAQGEFPCHKACKVVNGEFRKRNDKTPHCAGALIFNENRNAPHQMMRICERLGFYDRTNLDMTANVGSRPSDYLAQVVTDLRDQIRVAVQALDPRRA